MKTEHILELEKSARILEPNGQERAEMRMPVLQYAEQFLESLSTGKAWINSETKGKALLDLEIDEEPREMKDLLKVIEEEVDKPGLNPASGGHCAYIPGGGIYTASLGDYLADVSNRYAGIFYASPGAVRMENHLLRWMSKLVGYDRNSAGNLCSGGSIANLMGIVCARDAKNIKASLVERSVIYLTEQIHHSVHKAIRIAGLGEAIIRHVPMDTKFRLDARALEEMVKKDLDLGLKPWLVVASIGTTDTGAIDPLPQIAEIAKAHDLWLHVDGAYGGFFILTEEGREKIKGLDLADSIVMDPHKGLFLPYGTGAVLVKNKEHLYQSHYYQAAYMQDTISSQEEMSPADLSPELTKHFRGLRLWLPLMLHGLKPFRACLQEKLELARWFRIQIQEIPGMETGPEPDLSVTFFRLTRSGFDSNELNERLLKRIHEDGRVFLSSTRIEGEMYIRFACLCFRTHLSTAQKALDMIGEAIAHLKL